MNIANIGKLIQEKATSESNVKQTEITEKEILISNHLITLLVELSNSDSYVIETEDSLEHSDHIDPDPDYSIETTGEEEEQVGHCDFTLEYMQKVVDFARPGIAFTTIQHEYPRVTHRMQLKRFREYVENNGNRRQKLDRVEIFVLNKFDDARANSLPVHEVDIQRWALYQARAEGLDDFTASHHWLINFKRRNRISSRRVTKFICKREAADRSLIEKSGDQFVQEVTKQLPKYKLDVVLNADQSSFHYELASNRTLSYVGEKTTYLSVKSVNALTHSYTVMPVISAAGCLINPVFICLQEPTGRFPITKSILSVSNVVVTCSKSGKLTTSLFEYWIREVLNKVTNSRFLLLMDQWSPHTDITAYENNLNRGQTCKLMVIPGKTTSTKQPCDVYFFRQWKELTKRIYHRVALDQLDVDLRNRDAIIKLQSLVHNQLSSAIFRPLISFAWSSCGYIPQQYPEFLNVIEVCFSFKLDNCSENNCGESAFICCSHCRRTLCFEHFFIVYHFH